MVGPQPAVPPLQPEEAMLQTLDKTNVKGRTPASVRFPMSPEGWLSIAASLGLSERELQVVKSVFEGGTEVLIARRLNLSSHTVHTHLDRVYRKLRVSNRCGVVLKVFAEYLSAGPHDEAGSCTSNAEPCVDRQPSCEPATDQRETLD